jgi:hypothetical protein
VLGAGRPAVIPADTRFGDVQVKPDGTGTHATWLLIIATE